MKLTRIHYCKNLNKNKLEQLRKQADLPIGDIKAYREAAKEKVKKAIRVRTNDNKEQKRLPLWQDSCHC